jgi:hypothetical protein
MLSTSVALRVRAGLGGTGGIAFTLPEPQPIRSSTSDTHRTKAKMIPAAKVFLFRDSATLELTEARNV